MKMEYKHVGSTQIEAVDEGVFEAAIATFGVVDSDGDVIEPGAFNGARAPIIPAHNQGSVPLGKALVEERDGKAIAVGRFNLEVSPAVDWFKALKFDLEDGDPMQEWSWGFVIPDGGSTKAKRDGRDVRLIKSIDLIEISPVLRGASVGTQTLSAKGQKLEGMTDENIRQILQSAVADEEPDADYVWIEAFTDDAFVYSVSRDGEPQELLERTYSIRDGVASLGDDPVEVIREARYVRSDGKESEAESGIKLVDEIRAVTKAATDAVARMNEAAEQRSERGREMAEETRAEAIEMAVAVEEMRQVAKSLADLVQGCAKNDEVAEALSRWAEHRARWYLTG